MQFASTAFTAVLQWAKIAIGMVGGTMAISSAIMAFSGPSELKMDRKTTTLVADVRMTSIVALMMLDGPINGDSFEAYVRQVIVPTSDAATQ